MKPTLLLMVVIILGGFDLSHSEKIKYSMDASGKLKPNYCKRGACVKCSDMGKYFGCEKCVKYETRKIGILRCEDLNL